MFKKWQQRRREGTEGASVSESATPPPPAGIGAGVSTSSLSSSLSPTPGQPSSPNKVKLAKQSYSEAQAAQLAVQTSIAAWPWGDGAQKVFGIENYGFSCYAASIIQVLYHHCEFRHAVLGLPGKRKPRERRITSNGTAPHGFALAMREEWLDKGLLEALGRRTQMVNAQGNVSLVGFGSSNATSEQRKRNALLLGPLVNVDEPHLEDYAMGPPQALFGALKDTFEAIVENGADRFVVSPWLLVNVVKSQNEMFREAMHHDAHEFLNFLVNGLCETNLQSEPPKHAEISKGSEAQVQHELSLTSEDKLEHEVPITPHLPPSSPVSSSSFPAPAANPFQTLFQGTLTTSTTCLTCGTTSNRDESFLDLSVDLEPHSSLSHSLRLMSAPETLEANNKFSCEHCQSLQRAQKEVHIKQLPPLLSFHLKRFQYSEQLGRMVKLFHRVEYTSTLRVAANEGEKFYELYAVVVHVGGGPYHGHYVSIVNTPTQGWLLFDDESVERVDRDFVFKFFGDGAGIATAYLVFYKEVEDERKFRTDNLFCGLDEEGEEGASTPDMELTPDVEPFSTISLGTSLESVQPDKKEDRKGSMQRLFGLKRKQ